MGLELPVPKWHMVRVGIGIGQRSGPVLEAAREAGALGIDVTVYQSADELVGALKRGEVDCAVRGSLAGRDVMEGLKKAFKVEALARAALLDVGGGNFAFLYPVGISEGWTVAEKVETGRLCSALAGRLGMSQRVALLYSGREGDRGRHPGIDATIDSAEGALAGLRKAGVDAELVGIQLEKVAGKYGVIIAPDPTSGNLVFRALHLVAGRPSLGAPAMALDRVFVDTSRERKEYVQPLLLAAKLAGIWRKQIVMKD